MEPKKTSILFEDDSIIVCYKPPGVPTQSGHIGTPDMESMLKNHIHKLNPENHTPYLAVIHRLDQPVSGILVFAKTPYAAKILNAQLTQGKFGKYYLALVNGVPPKTEDDIEHYLVRDRRSNSSHICSKETHQSQRALLHYKLLEQRENKECLLEIHLDTGRHHQIRVQLSHIGCPIVGDTKYNTLMTKANHWQELKLCAYRLSFNHPVTRKPMTFEMEAFF